MIIKTFIKYIGLEFSINIIFDGLIQTFNVPETISNKYDFDNIMQEGEELILIDENDNEISMVYKGSDGEDWIFEDQFGFRRTYPAKMILDLDDDDEYEEYDDDFNSGIND